MTRIGASTPNPSSPNVASATSRSGCDGGGGGGGGGPNDWTLPQGYLGQTPTTCPVFQSLPAAPRKKPQVGGMYEYAGAGIEVLNEPKYGPVTPEQMKPTHDGAVALRHPPMAPNLPTTPIDGGGGGGDGAGDGGGGGGGDGGIVISARSLRRHPQSGMFVIDGSRPRRRRDGDGTDAAASASDAAASAAPEPKRLRKAASPNLSRLKDRSSTLRRMVVG